MWAEGSDSVIYRVGARCEQGIAIVNIESGR